MQNFHNRKTGRPTLRSAGRFLFVYFEFYMSTSPCAVKRGAVFFVLFYVCPATYNNRRPVNLFACFVVIVEYLHRCLYGFLGIKLG